MEKLFRQSAFLILAQGVSRVIGFFYTVYLARTLGVENFGLFSTSLAFFALISTVAELGFNRFIVREVALGKADVSSLISTVSLLRFTFTSVLFAVFAVVFYVFDPDKLRVCLMLLATMAVLPVSFSQTMDGIFVGLRKLKYSSISLIVTSLATAVAGVYLVGSGFSSMGALVALIFGQVIYVICLVLFLRKIKVKILGRANLSEIKNIIVGSLPYGILGILGLLYFRIDTLMLAYLRGNYETGIYAVGYKFLETIIFIPGSFASALFPVLAKLHDQDPHKIKTLYIKSLKLMGLIALPICLGYIFILPIIIKLLLPNYLLSIDVVKIITLSIPFIFLSTPGVQVMLSTDKYLKQVIWFSFIVVAFNIILNFIFIPKYGYLAAAWITVASDVLSFSLFYLFLSKRIFR